MQSRHVVVHRQQHGVTYCINILINSTVYYDGNVCSVSLLHIHFNGTDKEQLLPVYTYIREVCWNGCVHIELGRSNSQLGHSMPRLTHHRPHQTHNTRTYYPPIVHTFICAKWCRDDQTLTVQCCACSTPLPMYVPTLPLSLPSLPAKLAPLLC